ncbi:MAG: hypothetical protein WC878_04500 [Candidatus Paceibacterota bacterium]|jgi:hypothetical protein
MELSQDAIFFRSNDGSVFVYGDKWGQTLFYSPDGQVFFELFRHSIGGSPSEHDLWFEDARTHATARLRKKGEEIRLNGKTYKKTAVRTEVEAIPLPEVRRPKYLFGLPDEQYLYVSTDKYKDTHDSYKMFLGDGEAMKQIFIAKVDWRHDNGTFNILTDKGNLFIL